MDSNGFLLLERMVWIFSFTLKDNYLCQAAAKPPEARSVFATVCCSWSAFYRSRAAPGLLLGRSGPLLAALGGGSWAALGRSWAALASLLSALGALLAALGPLLERHAKIIEKSMPKMTDLSSQKHPKMTPTSDPKRSKIDAKNERRYL